MASIIIAFPKIEDARNIRGFLVKHGFDVQGVTNNASSAIGMANELDRGVVISGYKFQDMVYHELNSYLPREFQMLLVASPQLLQQCKGEDIMSLAMPLKVHELLHTLGMMVDCIEREERRRKKRARGRSEEERKTIAKAKQVLMERNNLTEEEAHRYIQKNSMDTGRSMMETSLMLLSIMQE